MKKLLLTPQSKLFSFYLRTLLVLFCIVGASTDVSAQCTLYQHYNSGTIPSGYTSTFTQATLTTAATGNAPRTGTYALTSGVLNNAVTTPSVTAPNKVSFWMRRGNGTSTGTAYFDFQVNDGTHGWQSLRTAANLTNYGILTYTANMTASATALTATYDNYSVTFDGTPAATYVNTNLTFRIVDLRGGFTGTMYLDDISWTSKTTALNDLFVPDMLNSPSTTSCTSNPLALGSTYTLYDVGGEFDSYQLGQDNTLVFQPSAGNKIEITFVNFASETTNDPITVLDGATNILTHSGPANPGTLIYTGTTGNNLTVRFVSNTNTTIAAGFKITVKCIAGSACALPGSPNAATNITATSASASWAAAAGPPAGYDIYYNTSNAVTPGTPQFTNVNSAYTMTGLASDTDYYYWVRSNCGGTQSAWVGPSAVFHTLCAPILPPYTENFNGQPTSAIPTCTAADNASWQVNTVNGYLTNNIIATNFYTRAVTLTGGTEYRLSYDYGSALGDLDLKVYYGSTNVAPTTAINTLLSTHLSVTGLNNNIVNFTPASTGTYYIRFELTRVSNSPNTLLILDNINLIQETCGPGRTLTASAVTASAATINWIVPASPYSPPAGGYQYYLSTSATTPLYSDTPTGTTAAGITTVNLVGLASSTVYYIWVRSNCSGYFSAWSVPTTFTTLAGATPLILDATTNGTSKTACDYSFFDSGGSSASYQNNENYTVTVYPAVAGTKAKVVFSTFATENNYDGLSIYDGNSTGAPLINSGLPAGFNATTAPAGSFYGTASPGTIISTATDGSLTFKFTTDASVLAAGWSAFISCVVTPTIASFTPTNNNCGGTGTVVITGTNFVGVTGVFFGGTSASYVVNSATQITATIPATASTGAISVATSSATGYSTTNFAMLAPRPVTTGVVICTGGSGSLSTSTICNGFVNSGTSISGSLTAGTDPTAPRPSPPGGNSATCSFLAGSVRNYQATQFQVSVTGSYIFQMSSPFDAMGYITSGSFTPGSCATGTYLVGDDDSNGGLQPRLTVTLTAGVTYTLYSTSWGTTGTVSGAFTWSITPAAGGQIMLAGNPNMNWYTVASGGTAIGTGATFNPVGVAGSGLANTNTAVTRTYYAACSSNPTCRTATTFVINARPTVTFTAQPGSTACTFNDVIYTTQPGQSNYVWTIPGQVLNTDYTIVSGGLGSTNNTVTLQWLTTGTKTVTINYDNAAGCTATTATSSTATTVSASGLSTTVTPATASICANSVQTLTASSGSANFFTWTTTAGSLFTDAACTIAYVPMSNAATVYFKGTGNAIVTASGTVGGTGCAASNTSTITVNKAVWNGTVWSNAGVGPSNTVSAEFTGGFTSSVNASATSGNLSACSVIVTSGSVLFDRGTLTVQNSVVVTAPATLTFNDTSYDVGLYQAVNVSNATGVYSGGNSGNISFNRSSAPLFRYDYTYWSAPVYPQNLLALSPGTQTSLFLEYNNAWQYVNPATTTMVPSKGYIFRAPQSYNLPPGTANVYQAPFIGVPNNGDLSIAIIGGAGQMNLLGNPYPSALSADDFILGNPNVNGTLYFWTHASQSTSPYQYANTDYAVYTLAGGTGTSAHTSAPGASNNSVPLGYIASGQGFFVKGLSNSTALFTNSMRRAGNNSQFYKSGSFVTNEIEKNRYWLNILSTDGAFKQALVGYIENATSGIDRLFDGEMVDAGNAISLYTKVDDTKLSVQGRPLPFDVNDTVPLSYKSTIATTYTITIPESDGLFTSQHVYLEDLELNTIHDLMEGGYTFVTEAGTFENRFVLRYTETALGTDNPVFNESSVIVYRNTQGIFINTGVEPMKTVTIYDITGRLIAAKKGVDATAISFTNLPSTQQVLLVKIEGESGKTVTKKVVY